MTETAPRLILAFVADLYFASRIESTADQLNCQVLFIERPDQIPVEGETGNYTSAHSGKLLEMLRTRRPALLVFDLNNKEIPWEDWIPAVRADPDLASLPVVAFGSHVETDTLARARSAGAQAVLARSRFFTGMMKILEKYLPA
jgi:CheY-like chemotaxis protein